MKKLLLMKTVLLLFALVVGSTSVWATDVVAYTLTPASGSNNSYASNCDITISSITWNLTGNSQKKPWRIGGKNLSSIDRTLYSKTVISDNVTKIEVTHGTASNITVNSWTVIVSKNSDFSNPVSTLTPSFTASETTTINRPDGKDWSNCYFKFIYNVSVSGNDNKFLEFTNAKFYKEASSGGSTPSISLGSTTVNAPETAVSTTTINVTYNNLTNYDAEVHFYESDGTTDATYDHSWLTAEINGLTMNLDYSIAANTGAARTAYLKVYAIGEEGDVESSLITITQAAKTVNPPTFNLSTGTFLEGTGIVLSTDADGNTIRYNITTNGAEPSAPTKTTGTLYESPIILSGNCTTKIKAIAVDAYGNVSNATTRSYTVVAPTPTDLPFNWAGGGRDAFNALPCVFSGGLGTDYATEDHSPYLIKFDTDNDYILIFTNSQPGKLSIGVKMIGGATTSTIKVQEGTTGTGVFTDVESLTISGKQNNILNLSTTNAFATTTRVIKLLFVKGSNVGVGPISIAIPEAANPVDNGDNTITLTTSDNMDGWRAFYDASQDYELDEDTKAYVVTAKSGTEGEVELTKLAVTAIPHGEAVILKTSAANHQMVLTETTGVTSLGTNLLAVTNGTDNVDGYRLGYGEISGSNTVGFFKYTTTTAPAAGIVYIDKSNVNVAAGARGLTISCDDDATAIETVKSEKANNEYFNLAGQRVANPTKGLYIVNGRKVVVK